MIGFVIWLFFIRQCAYMGSRRVIGALDGALLGIFFSIVGIMMVYSSRRLDDDKTSADLYKPEDNRT